MADLTKEQRTRLRAAVEKFRDQKANRKKPDRVRIEPRYDDVYWAGVRWFEGHEENPVYEWGINPMGFPVVARGCFYVVCAPEGYEGWDGQADPEDRYRMLEEHPDGLGGWPRKEHGATDDPKIALRWLSGV